MPNRCEVREIGAMNVYSIVPSQRSQATVSVTISKIRPRYDQITAPISSTIVDVVHVQRAAACLHALGDKDDRERIGDRVQEPRQLPPREAADQVHVALDDAGEADHLAAERPLLGPDHALTSSISSVAVSSSGSSSNDRPVAFRNACSSVSAP